MAKNITVRFEVLGIQRGILFMGNRFFKLLNLLDNRTIYASFLFERHHNPICTKIWNYGFGQPVMY